MPLQPAANPHENALIPGVLWALAGLFLSALPISAQSDLSTEDDLQAKVGEVILVTVETPETALEVSGVFRGRTVPFFPLGPSGRHGALLGIDLDDQPATEEMVIEIQGEGGKRQQRRIIRVEPKKFRVEELKVPKEKDTFDEKTLQRIGEERRLILEKLSGVSQEKLWEGEFFVPLKGEKSSNFGSKRIINGIPRNPHSGEDIQAKAGTAVQASNQGRIALVGDFFFSGKSILIDHGLGLFTMYFHLSKVLVKEGEPVSKGQVIGEVGSSGRATGPHLHWGARLNGSRVDPFSLVQLPLRRLEPAASTGLLR